MNCFCLLLYTTGGGVLAHTILGVDFSDKTGEIKYVSLERLKEVLGTISCTLSFT